MQIDYRKYPLPKRLRHHTKPNLYIKQSELNELSENYPPVYTDFDWKSFFSNSKAPDVLDIGCGKGIFLLNLSRTNPQKNFLGIELRKQIVEWINTVITGENIQNCFALWYSVVNGLPFIKGNSIEKVFYLFPDPWPKRKHLKRRAFNEDFICEVNRILKPGGKLYLATDLKEVDAYHKKILKKTGYFIIEEVSNDSQWMFPPTNKEIFCRKEGIEFFRLICSKNSS